MCYRGKNLVCVLVLAFVAVTGNSQQLNIIPYPNSITILKDSFGKPCPLKREFRSFREIEIIRVTLNFFTLLLLVAGLLVNI